MIDKPGPRESAGAGRGAAGRRDKEVSAATGDGAGPGGYLAVALLRGIW